jgi:flagellar basal-body rod protein FlgB
MFSTGISAIDLAEQRLRWLERRQSVLANNVANANTPGFRPRDLTPFGLAMVRAVGVARTDTHHLLPVGSGPDGSAWRDRSATELSPDGNAVSLEQQALKVADTDHAHALATAVHRRWATMFRLALGTRIG